MKINSKLRYKLMLVLPMNLLCVVLLSMQNASSLKTRITIKSN